MGNGIFCKDVLVSNDVHYTGCDYSELMVKEASAINESFVKSGKAIFVHGDMNALPFADSSFNKIFTVNTIYFWDKPDTLLSEIRRVLSDDGIFVIALRTESSMKILPFTDYGFTLYDEGKLTKMLQENDFKVLKMLKQNDVAIESQNGTIQMENLVVTCMPV
jgi:ubiquinone/menaquinone biosynthesis C-methylase UbiE